MKKEDIINFIFSQGTYKDPFSGNSISWSLEEEVANALFNNMKVNSHTNGYEIAEVNMETGAIEYRYSTTLIPETGKIIIMHLDTSNPPATLKYHPNLKDILQSYQQ